MFYIVIFALLAVLGGANYYLANFMWRWMHQLVPKFSIAMPLVIFGILTILTVLGFFKPFQGGLQRCISFAGNIWMGIFVYMLLLCIAADLVLLLVWLLRIVPADAMTRIRIAAGISATVFAIAVSIYGMCNARNVHKVEYDVQLSDAPSSQLTVALISDVHLGAIGSEKRLEKIVEKINAMSPDIVCIAGDLFDTDYRTIKDPQTAIGLFQSIDSTYGVYACLGNHDAGQTLPQMLDFMQQADIQLLADAYVVIDDRLILAGRLDPSPIGGVGELKRGQMETVLQDADQNLLVIVLDHNPASVDSYHGKADLILSGHTHKGQLFPGSLITNAINTVDYGYYRASDGTQTIVTSGAGAWGPPMRVGTQCEVVKINLQF